MIEVYIDRLCEPINLGGTATYGYIIRGEINEEGKGVVGQGNGMSNNVAEYSGLIRALQRLSDLDAQDEEIVIYSDSKIVVNQMSGRWRVHKGLYVPYYRRARDLSKQFSDITYEHVPREQNTEADQLSRDAYRKRGKSGNIKIEF